MVGNKICPWESKGLSNEKIGSTKTSNYDQSPGIIYDNATIKLRFARSVLKQNKVTYNHRPKVNIYIVYILTSGTRSTGITLENYLFGAVKLAKIVDIVIIFGADLSSSTHANNKTGNILVLGKDFVQGIENTKIYTEKMYSTNFTLVNKKCLFKFAL